MKGIAGYVGHSAHDGAKSSLSKGLLVVCLVWSGMVSALSQWLVH